jgi:peroxiredoxin
MLVAVNLLLVKQNFGMRRQLTDRATALSPTARSLKEGEVVALLSGSDLNGQPFQLKYKNDERQYLLMYFSPSCTFCVQQAPLWRDVLNKIDSSRFAVVGIVSDREDKKAVFTHADELGYFKTRTPLPVVFVSNESLAGYKLMATPTTLLINGAGSVEHVWVGKWDQARVDEVTAALK